MAIFTVSDLHGNARLIRKTVESIKRMENGDTLIINGDGAGSRGPSMNKLVKIFYEVRRGETDFEVLVMELERIIGTKMDLPKDWVFNSVHAGIFRALLANHYDAFRHLAEAEVFETLDETLGPISEAANSREVRVFYVPGNGEMTPSDFLTEDISREKALQPEQRFYQRIAREGYFIRLGIEYVPYAYLVGGNVALIGTNLLDLDAECVGSVMMNSGLLNNDMETVIVHYPPAVSPTGKYFDFWNPNSTDVARIDALDRILMRMKTQKSTKLFFGHIHLNANDPRMERYPATIGVGKIGKANLNSIWVKPGEVIRINA